MDSQAQAQDKETLSDSLTGHIAAIAKTMARGMLGLKVLMVVAAAVSSVMQFMPSGGADPTVSQLVGGLASAVLAIFGVIVIYAEKDASEMLLDANKALTAARKTDAELAAYEEMIDDLENDLNKHVELYIALGNARNIYEQAITTGNYDMDGLLRAVLTVSRRQFAAAMDIQTPDRWTLCIYKAEAGETSRQLRVVAQIRAIECDPKDARTWPEGVGFAGIALASGQEVIIGDMSDVSVGSILNHGYSRPHDTAVYKSAIACPIFVGDDNKRPWGVATATNDRADHFVDDGSIGVHNGEAVRAVANMAAMIVSLCNHKQAPQTETQKLINHK